MTRIAGVSVTPAAVGPPRRCSHVPTSGRDPALRRRGPRKWSVAARCRFGVLTHGCSNLFATPSRGQPKQSPTHCSISPDLMPKPFNSLSTFVPNLAEAARQSADTVAAGVTHPPLWSKKRLKATQRVKRESLAQFGPSRPRCVWKPPHFRSSPPSA